MDGKMRRCQGEVTYYNVDVLYMKLENLIITTIETLPLRQSLVKKVTPKIQMPLELCVSNLLVKK